MRGLTLAALLLSTTAAIAQTPVFTSIQAGNLALNVKGAPYNAKCDGTTDDTVAIQSAIAAGVSSGQSFTLLLPAGVCKTTAALTITGATGQDVAIKGESRATSQLLVTGTGDGIDITMNQQGSNFYTAQLDVTDLTILASGSAGTAIKAVSTAASAVSPKFHLLRIGGTGSGSFANGISTKSMSNVIVRDVNINSPNATGIAFQIDGDSRFPSITDNFSDIYFWNFAVGIQLGNGTTSYVQGIEVTNAQLQQNNGKCISWNNSTTGFLGDMLLVANSFCNGSINVFNVEDVVIQGNYFLSAGVGQVALTTATSYIVSNNTFNGAGPNTNGIVITNSHGLVSNNHFIQFAASGSAPIIFNSNSVWNVAVDNKCDSCGSGLIVNDFGLTNWQKNNINTGNVGPNGATVDNTVTTLSGQQTWKWLVPASPAFTDGGAVVGWNYLGQGETDMFLARSEGGPHGYSEVWYDTTAHTIGAQLMGLTIDGFLSPNMITPINGMILPQKTFATLPACTSVVDKNVMLIMTDAVSPTYNGVISAGGGSVTVPVLCNGTNWVAH